MFHSNKYFTAELNFDFLYDLTKETNEETLQRLPEIRLYFKERKIKHTPFYIDFLSVNTNFFRDKGEKGWRNDNILRLNNYSYWWRYSNRFTISPRITTYSSLENTEAKEGTRKLLIVEDVVRTTTIKQHKNFSHYIIPEIKFTYISKSNQEDFPIFDKEDRIDSFKDIDFSLFNILSFSNEDFLRWTVSFGYTFLGKYKISENFFDGNIKPLKNSFYFKIGKLSGENNLFFDFKRGIKRSITSLELPITSWFKYTIDHSYDRGLTFPGEEFHQLGQSFTINIKNIEIYGSILNNIIEGFVQQKRFYIALDRKCWKFKIKYVEDFNKETNKTYSSFLIAVNLLNIEYALPFLKPKWRQQSKS
jgi:LPS-assembly protein